MQALESSKTKGRVLAVDDCEIMRTLLQAVLESLGYSVQAVDSGRAALEAAGGGEFDAIILDVEMPGLDGISVGRALRQDPRTAMTMIALHTSMDEADVRLGFDQYDDFLAKPGGLVALGDRLDRLMLSRRLPGLGGECGLAVRRVVLAG